MKKHLFSELDEIKVSTYLIDILHVYTEMELALEKNPDLPKERVKDILNKIELLKGSMAYFNKVYEFAKRQYDRNIFLEREILDLKFENAHLKKVNESLKQDFSKGVEKK